jgi:protein required for attachment to host cells
MRPQFHAELSKRIVREISKTLVNSTKEDIEKALA